MWLGRDACIHRMLCEITVIKSGSLWILYVFAHGVGMCLQYFFIGGKMKFCRWYNAYYKIMAIFASEFFMDALEAAIGNIDRPHWVKARNRKAYKK